MEIELLLSHDDHPLLLVKGSLSYRNLDALKGHLDELLQGRKSTVVVGMDQVDYIDSSALGTLIQSDILLKRKGGGIILQNVTPGVLDIMAIGKVDKFIELRRHPADT